MVLTPLRGLLKEKPVLALIPGKVFLPQMGTKFNDILPGLYNLTDQNAIVI